jgi:hypothetical protein
MNLVNVVKDCLVCITLMIIMIVIIVGLFPQLGLSLLPKEVQNKCTLPPLTKKKKIIAYILYTVFGLVFIAYLFYMIFAAYKEEAVSYWIIFLHYFIVINIVHLFDVVILDWWIISKVTPKILYRIFPGTENSQGYKKFGFNIKEHVKNFIGTVIGGIALAGIAYGILLLSVW